jgi:hypothetical protein
MKWQGVSTVFRSSTFAVVALLGLGVPRALAQDHSHGMTAQHEMTQEQKKKFNELVATVRTATEQFQNPADAEGMDYHLKFGCVSGGDFGAMGLHFVNMNLIGDDIIDPMKPEIILYEALPNGRLRLSGADFLVFADVWNSKHPEGPPELGGQLFHFFDAPNRFGLPPFYTLHVWAWKDNPAGTFTNWNPKVSCDGFNGDK